MESTIQLPGDFSFDELVELWDDRRGQLIHTVLYDPYGRVAIEQNINASRNANLRGYIYSFTDPDHVSPPIPIWNGEEGWRLSLRNVDSFRFLPNVEPLAPIRDGIKNCLVESLQKPIDKVKLTKTKWQYTKFNNKIEQEIMEVYYGNPTYENLEQISQKFKLNIHVYLPHLLNTREVSKSKPIQKFIVDKKRNVMKILILPGHAVNMNSIREIEVEEIDKDKCIIHKTNPCNWGLIVDETGSVIIQKSQSDNKVEFFIEENRLIPTSLKDYDAELIHNSLTCCGPYHTFDPYTGKTEERTKITKDGKSKSYIHKDIIEGFHMRDGRRMYTQESKCPGFEYHPQAFGSFIEETKLNGPGFYYCPTIVIPKKHSILKEVFKENCLLSDLHIKLMDELKFSYNITGACHGMGSVGRRDIFDILEYDKKEYGKVVGSMMRIDAHNTLSHKFPVSYVKWLESFASKEIRKFDDRNIFFNPTDSTYALHATYIVQAMQANMIYDAIQQGTLENIIGFHTDAYAYTGHQVPETSIMANKDRVSIERSFQMASWASYGTNIPTQIQPQKSIGSVARIKVHYGLPGSGKTTSAIWDSRYYTLLLTNSWKAANDKNDEVYLSMPIQDFAKNMSDFWLHGTCKNPKVSKNYKKICNVSTVIIDQAQFNTKEELQEIFDLPEFSHCNFHLIYEDGQTSVVSKEIPVNIETEFPKDKYPWIFHDTFYRSEDPRMRQMITELYYAKKIREMENIIKKYIPIHTRCPNTLEGVLMVRYYAYGSYYAKKYFGIDKTDKEDLNKLGIYSVEAMQGESNKQSKYNINLYDLSAGHILSAVSRSGSFEKLYIFKECLPKKL